MDNIDVNMWDHYQTQERSHLDLNTVSRSNFIYKKVNKYIKNKKTTIVEMGFGNGYLLNKLSGRYNIVYGLDISLKNIKLTKKQFPNINYKLIDTTGKLPFEANTIDCFIASEVIEHMTKEELFIFAKELNRVLKKNGIFIGTTPANENLKEAEITCPGCSLKYHPMGHKQSFNLKKLLILFNDLTKVTIKQFYPRYIGKNLFEKSVGFLFFIYRNLFGNLLSIKKASFLFIFKKTK